MAKYFGFRNKCGVSTTGVAVPYHWFSSTRLIWMDWKSSFVLDHKKIQRKKIVGKDLQLL